MEKAQRKGNAVRTGLAFGLLLLPELFCPGGSPRLEAQVYLGSIQGEVSDPAGAKVADASVTITEVSTQFKTSVTTNHTGLFNIPGLTPGTYTVIVVSPGFRTATRTNVVLTSGELAQVDFQLVPGTRTEQVRVSAENTLLDTSSPNISTTLSTHEVTDLPNIGRDPYVLATLAVGVINGGSGGYFQGSAHQYTNPFSGVAVQLLADGTSGHNRLTLDGIPNDPPERFSGPTYAGFTPSPEAVQEVKVSSSIFDAQIGHGNGTVTDTIIRSGANQPHGAAYYVFQNTYLNANVAQNVPTQNLCWPGTPGCTNTTTPARRNNDQLNQSGFVFDGPAYLPHLYNGRNKTFFLVSYERYDSHAAQNYSARVPTAAELGGDFSALCNSFNNSGFCTSGIQLYQPNSPLDSNGNRTQYFAYNNIATALNQTGKDFAAFLPAPNIPGAASTATNYMAVTGTSYASIYPSFITRVDQAVGEKDKLNAIYFQAGLTQQFPLEGFTHGYGPSGYGYTVYRDTRGGSLDHVHLFSSSLVLDSRFGLIYHPFGLEYPGHSNFNLSSLGIRGAGLPYATFPGVSVSGYTSLAPGAGGQVSESTNGSLDEILTKTAGTHVMRFGLEGNLLRYNVQSPQSGFGAFGFDQRFTQQNSLLYAAGNYSDSGDGMADMLLGAFSSATYTISASYALQQIYLAPFFQDDWRLSPHLTLNLGARWDYESPLTERFNKQVTNFCFTCASPLQGNGTSLVGGLTYADAQHRTAYPADLHAWQPRLGAAYELTNTTVFRAGFGIIYFNTVESPIGTGFSQTTSYDNYQNVNSSAPLNAISDPFPDGVVLPSGSSQGLATGLGTGISFIDPHHVPPRAAEYTFNVQQQFPGNFSLQVAYVGSKPTRLEVNHNIDLLPARYYNQGVAGLNYLTAAVPNPLANLLPADPTQNGATVQRYYTLLPYPQFNGVTELYSSIGSSPYNALQVQVGHPLRSGLTLQGNFTWDKVMLHQGYLDNYATVLGKLYSVEDGNPTLFGNIFGTYQLPVLDRSSHPLRLALGGWQLNGVARFSNGTITSAPGSIDIIGNYRQPHQTYTRAFNTCYQSETITGNSVTYTNVPTLIAGNGYPSRIACDATSPRPAFRQRIPYSSQSNSTVLNVRDWIYPLVDASLFKTFALPKGLSFEIRGEFFNILNSPEWGGINSSLGTSSSGSVAGAASPTYPNGQFYQNNDPRIGQLTARLNF
jgi:hypothetical protein